jgi:hypothetical protein
MDPVNNQEDEPQQEMDGNEGEEFNPENGDNEEKDDNEHLIEQMNHREKRLADAKASRKQVQKDAELLKNRIALLQMEERKARKKIEETKKRTSEVVVLKKRNKMKFKEKIYKDKKDKQEKIMLKQRNDAIRKQRLEEQRKIKEALLISKKQEAKMAKLQKKQNDQRRKNQKKREEQENKLKTDIIRQHHNIQKIKKDEHKRKIEKESKNHYDSKIDDEENFKVNKENEVMELERIEMELIKKLQNTQQVQKDAYNDLESALAKPTPYLKPSRVHDEELENEGMGDESD